MIINARGTDNPLTHAMCMQEHLNLAGNLLMNHKNMEQMAKDKAFWKERSRLI